MDAAERKAFSQNLKRFTLAAGKGDIGTMETMIAAQPRLLTSDVPLLEACLHGKLPALQLLIRHGLTVDGLRGVPTTGRRPLTRVILRTKGVPWNADHEAVLRFLLDQGANLAAVPGWPGMSAICLAAGAANRSALEILRERIGELDLFDAAATADRETVTKRLIEDPKRASQTNSGNATALQCCAFSALGKDDPAMAVTLAEIAGELIAKGAPLDPVPAGKNTTDPAWRLACRSGNDAVLRVLIRHGIDGPELFFQVLDDQRLEVLDTLLEKNPRLDLNLRLPKAPHNPLLHELVRYGKLQAANWLLDRGADPNLRNDEGLTALHYAARRGLGDGFLKNLVDHGADKRVQDAAGRTPRELAVAKGKTKVADWLESQG